MNNKCENNASEGSNIQHFDVIISGGGLSGALMALSLAPLKHNDGQPLTIAIIEANPVLTDPTLTFDDRVLALSHGSAAYLMTIGAWQTLADKAEAIEKIHVSDRGHYGKARIEAKKHHVPALGYVVEMSLLGQSLLKALKTKKNITWFAPDTIADITWQQAQVELTLASNKKLTSHLLLGCDGGMSTCRQFANIEVSSRDYEQSALIANVSTALHHNNIAYERFTETGPIAMLPLSTVNSFASKHSEKSPKADTIKGRSRCSLVWTLTPEMAQQMKTLNDDAFKKVLEQAFGSWLGSITNVGKRTIFPLKLLQAKAQVFHRMALIGNASHTIHPIAGQGFNLGLRDVAAMTALVKQQLVNQQDIGQLSSLTRYEEARKQDHQQVISLTDSLVTLFSNQLPPLVAGRNIGLKVLNYFSPLKKALVKKTMGY
jgi:2-octaprenyl-6-methoxyphenol hydroxylase